MAFKIDSFKLSIPLSAVADGGFLFDMVHEVSSDTGEILNTKHRLFKKEFRNVDFYVKLNTLFDKQFLEITVNSKMLFSDYFQGINSNNLSNVVKLYKLLFGFNLSSDFSTISYISDIDICYDFSPNDTFRLQDQIKKWRKEINNSKAFYTKNEFTSVRQVSGFQLNTRNMGSVNNPFLKYYLKPLEMVTNSKEFTTEWLPTMFGQAEFFRVEFTLRNSKMIKSVTKQFGKQNFSLLSNFLNLHTEQFKKIYLYLFNPVFRLNEVSEVTEKIPPAISLSDYLILKNIIFRMKKGESFHEVITQLFENSPYLEASNSRKKTNIRSNVLEALKDLDLDSLKDDFWIV